MIARQIGGRLATALPSVIGVVVVTFLLTRILPGDTAAYFAGPAATPQAIAEIRAKLGPDQPLPVQFIAYVRDLAHGNLGTSLTTGQPVLSDIASRLPASAELILVGLFLAVIVALPLGVLAAVRQGSLIDHACRVIATAGVSLPVFFTGLLLVTGGALALFLLLLLAAIVGPYVVPYSPLATDTLASLQPPSARHWCGTDQLGRDIPSRVVVATRLDMTIAITSVAAVFVANGFAGIAAGYFGGWTDRVVGRIADTIMAIPLFVLAMGIVAALGNTVTNIIIATAIVNSPLYARVARAEANVRRDAGFVMAARLTGNSDWRILLSHIMPNILPIMVVQMSLTMGYAILNAAGLSFIGLGVRPPTPEWGIMVAEGASNIVSGDWWVALFPGLTLMLAVFCFNLLGDGLRDIVDRQRRT